MTPLSLALQLLNGLATASSLFLVAAGLTLIFGVTRIINFAHGSLYMLGAYAAYGFGQAFARAMGAGAIAFWSSIVAAALAIALIGALIERLLLRRLYGAPELLQLTATFGVLLIVRDAALAMFGAQDRLGPRAPGLAGVIEIAGRAIPQYDLFLIVVGPLVLVALTLLVSRTRFGVLVRAAAENRLLAAALGVDEARLFTTVFALGAFLAGLAGALQLPREPANLNMDLAVVADAFVVTVVGGLGSIPGAFVAALLIGITKALCIGIGDISIGGMTFALPKLTLVIEFIVMAIVLAIKPQGLFGRPIDAEATTRIPEQRTLVVPPGRREVLVAIVLFAALVALPAFGDDYLLVLATDILIAALFTASLQFITGNGGLTSFGHAAYFGIGAYAAALAARCGLPFAIAIALAPVGAGIIALAFGALCVRLSGVYLAMLTLAFAQITWSVAIEWDSVTGGSNGLVGVWPPPLLSGHTVYYLFTLVLVAIALAAIVRFANAPFGFAVRTARDAIRRTEALGVSTRLRQWQAFALGATFAGFAGGLYAFSKGSISPESLAIPKSVDALVMLLLGGINALFGPLAGAAIYTWLQDTLARWTEYWRACVGVGIILLVTVFPYGVGGVFSRWTRSRLPQ